MCDMHGGVHGGRFCTVSYEIVYVFLLCLISFLFKDTFHACIHIMSSVSTIG